MFGWLKRNAAPAASLLPDRPTHDVNGRPIIPALNGFSHPEAATDEQKLAALRWAAAWCGYQGEVTNAWLHGLANALVGRREKGVRKGEFEEEKRVLGMATRALRLEAQRTRASRVISAFPFAQFRLGPVDTSDKLDCPCAQAVELQGQIIPLTDFSALPLPGCDAHACKCWFRSVTRAEAKKAGISC